MQVQLRLGGRRVNVDEGTCMGQLLELEEQTPESASLDVLNNIVEHDKVEGCVLVGLGKVEVGNVAC